MAEMDCTIDNLDRHTAQGLKGGCSWSPGNTDPDAVTHTARLVCRMIYTCPAVGEGQVMALCIFNSKPSAYTNNRVPDRNKLAEGLSVWSQMGRCGL